MRKLKKLLRSRLLWSCIFILSEFALMLYATFWAAYTQGYAIVFFIISIVVVLCLMLSNENPSYKVVWIALSAVFPAFGGLLYLLFGNKKIGRRSLKRIEKYTKQNSDPKTNASAQKHAEEVFLRPVDRRMSSYIYNMTGSAAFSGTRTSYFPLGEMFEEDLVKELGTAEHFIFIEYFIIGTGRFWNRILGILEEKVEQGVDVRVIYDDLGSINAIPMNYWADLEKLGIRAGCFNPVRFHANPRLNFRDHKKILVIDGNVCYTGGLNLADEYVNDDIRFGLWKDNALKMEGEAVFTMTRLFLDTWCVVKNEDEDIELYRPTRKYLSDGLVQPFGSNPLKNEPLGENAYIQMINSAKKYVWITTPYLVPDDALISALRMAAQSGIDVRIITPYYPDKWQVHEVTKSNYDYLINAGVKIYEFTPGFIHSKMVLADDIIACVGTTNLDYRSFFLHFELSVVFWYSTLCDAVKEDFNHLFELSRVVEYGEVRKLNLAQRVMRYFYRLFSPAL